MVENHIHHYLQPFGVCLFYQRAKLFIASETAVCLIIIGDGIPVIGASLHVVLLNGVEPNAGDA